MKKILTLACAAIIGAMGLHAENYHVGGNLGIWRNVTDKTTSVTIKPEISYSLSDQFLVGTEIGYQYRGTKGAHNSQFVIDPYARYTYFKQGIVGLFVDGGVDFGLGRTSWKGGHSDCSVNLGVGLKPGVAIDVTKNFTFVAKFGFLGYQYANKAARVGGFKTGFGFDFSNDLNLGFYYNF